MSFRITAYRDGRDSLRPPRGSSNQDPAVHPPTVLHIGVERATLTGEPGLFVGTERSRVVDGGHEHHARRPSFLEQVPAQEVDEGGADATIDQIRFAHDDV